MPDPIKAAKHIFNEFLSKADPLSVPRYSPDAKDLQAQAAGLRGSCKGGLARAASLSPKRRRGIATKAAKARWAKP